jgi:tRNA pseudouridine55 synthase
MNNTLLAEEFIRGKVLLFNKPLYWTSFDLVRKVRNIIQHWTGINRIKVGHAGTLDPLATGLLIICTGKETRNIEIYQSQPKEYQAKIILGATTPSFDLETTIDHYYPYQHITRSEVVNTLADFVGIQLQEPPRFSARFVNGKRAYKIARTGESMLVKAKEIEIQSIELQMFNLPIIELKVRCSKGTYIRSLARDIGIKLGSGAYLAGLVRTAIGEFELNNAINIKEFEKNLSFL